VKNTVTYLKPKEQDKILQIPNPEYPTGLRNKLIMKILLDTGIKSNELINLKWENIYPSDKIKIETDNRINDRLTNKISEDSIKLLNDWKQKQKAELEERNIDDNPEYIFTTLKGKKISNAYLRQMLYRMKDKSHLEKEVNPSVLRNTFAIELYKKTKDVNLIKEKLGLDDISSVSKYINTVKMEDEDEVNIPVFKGLNGQFFKN
jgi:integrase/recombinase XerD